MTQAPTPGITGELTPYRTLTPTIPKPTATMLEIIPATPAPTSTPFLHTITNDDTMLGIAFKYGITLEELQAANPGVDSHYLSVGKQLIIPIDGEISQSIPTITPAPVDMGQPNCYRTGDDGAWCIIALHNGRESSIENISVGIRLFSSEGNNFTNRTAYPPLNLLPKESTIPIMMYFSPPLPLDFYVQSQLVTASIIKDGDMRYLDAQVSNKQIVLSPDNKSAIVSGKVNLTDESLEPSQLWVLGIAYDLSGNIIGMHKWESSGDLDFEFTIYSLSSLIDRVELIVEARQ